MTDITIPPSAQFETTRLDLPSTLDYEDWQGMAPTLGRISRAWQFWVGDWLNFGEAVYGDKYVQAVNDLGIEYSTVRNVSSVAARVAPERRREDLPWSYHEAVAGLGAEAQERILGDAETKEWTREQVRRAARDVKSALGKTWQVIYAAHPTPQPIPADSDAVLFLRSTSAAAKDAIRQIASWAFRYRNVIQVEADRENDCPYVQASHALLFIADRGDPPAPATKFVPPRKPIAAPTVVEALYPSQDKLAMFTTIERNGWTASTE